MAGPDSGVLRTTLLPGGLRVITDEVPGLRSVALGIWIGVGSRDERAHQAGAAHYLEHLLFKGTPTRSAWDISAQMEAVGGEMNAFTTKEYTCFHARVLAEHLGLAVDITSDVVLRGTLRSADVESERGVILEEIAMHDDDASDLVHDLAAEQVFGGAGLGRPILGTVDSIRSLTRGAIASFHRRHYRPENMVVAAAGGVSHRAVVARVRKAFAGLLDGAQEPYAPRSGATLAIGGAGSRLSRRRPTEQTHLVLTLPGLTRTDERRYALSILNAVLGGGMSSRLFQSVREERGLAYSVYSYVTHFSDAGTLNVYAGCQPERAADVVDLCRAELAALCGGGLTASDVARGKGQVKGSLILGQEDAGARMSRAAKSELLGAGPARMDDLIGRVDSVTVAQVRELAAELLAAEPALALVGPDRRRA